MLMQNTLQYYSEHFNCLTDKENTVVTKDYKDVCDDILLYMI